MGYLSSTRSRLSICLMAVAMFVLTLAVAAPAALAASPVIWSPTDSTYGVSDSSFYVPPVPLPPGTGATQPSGNMAYGCGFWDAGAEVFAFGFINAIPTSTSLPSLSQTELASTALPAGTPLTLVFTKAAGQRIDSVAIIGDPNALVSLDYAPAASLTEATRFTVQATIADTVASASGNVGAAFGLVIDCAAANARDFYGSLFVADMHWLDIDPPTFTSAGLAGLSASGLNGVTATFDGILSPAFLAAAGIADPSTVQGYVDAKAFTGWAGATFSTLGAGDGSLWPAGFWKYRITNSTWSRHNIMFGRQVAPTKPASLSPKGTITGTRPTFKWRTVGSAVSYEIRVYKGTRLLLKKTGCTAISWRASKALPRAVYLTWKVRGVNGAGTGAWSTALRFKIR